MAQPLIDRVLSDARTIIADRRRRTRGFEAATAQHRGCDPCDEHASRFCAVGALIRAAYVATGERERAHLIGWQVAGLVAKAANLRCPDDGEAGWSLARLNDTRGQAAVLRAVDALIGQRRA